MKLTKEISVNLVCMPLVLVFLLVFLKAALGSDMPVGIPSPVLYFGGFDPISTPAPVVNDDGTCDRCPGWPSSPSPGCYFIDKTNPNATDSNNPYGYPDKPRLTPPEGQLNAGDFVYFNAGTYTASDSKGDRFDWSGQGTASNPIWICGNPKNKPVLQDYINIGGNYSVDYLIFDNLEVSGSPRIGIDIRPTSDGVSIKHVVIRNCTITGTQTGEDRSGVTVGFTGGSSPNDTEIEYTVICNNHISNLGDKNSTEECGVYLGFHTDYTWVLNNTIHDVGADGVAGCHKANDSDKIARHYFIGNNTIYRTGENSIDLKAIQDYVISQNNLFGPYTRENGWAIVLHYGAYSIGCKRGWIILNKIHNASGGAMITNVDDETFIIGNVIYNIYDNPSRDDPMNGAAIGFRGMNGKLMIVNNTLYNYETSGIICNQETLNSNDTVVIENNIFANKSSSNGYEIRIDGGEDRITIRNNQYYYNKGLASFFWNNDRRTLIYMKSMGQCQGGLEGDPRFVNPPSDFSLQANSPAIDKGLESSAYAAFQAEYSLDIKKDFLGTSRPQGPAWDIGAYEYVENSGSTGSPPPTPNNLRIQ